MRAAQSRWERVVGRLPRLGPWLLSAAVAVGLSLLLSNGRDESETRPGPQPGTALRSSADAAAQASASRSARAEHGARDAGADRHDPAGGAGAGTDAELDAEPTYLDGEAEAQSQAAPAPLACLIEPHEVVEIGSPVRGRIDQLRVERGDSVTPGQVLVELESSLERAAVESARIRAEMEGDILARRASARLGERKQDRARRLFANHALSLDVREETETEAELARFELQRARENQELARAELERALAALEQRVVRSPIAGIVVERRMAPGEVVDEQTILRLAQIDPLRVEVVLPAALIGRVQPGMRAAITPELSGDEVHVAQVKLVDRVIDAASGTFEVRLELPNPDGAIPGGLNCQVRFLGE